jgi:hypothetical protein
MKDETALLPSGEWVNPEKEAERWDLPVTTVKDMMEQVEDEKKLEIELKVRRRSHELLEYLRTTHDREASKAHCNRQGCNAGPWDTWGDMAAHIRAHLVLESEDDAVVARVLNDTEKLVHPETELKLKVKADESDRKGLLDQVAKGLARQLRK